MTSTHGVGRSKRREAGAEEQHTNKRTPVYVIVICEAQRVNVGKKMPGRGGEWEVVHVQNQRPFDQAN